MSTHRAQNTDNGGEKRAVDDLCGVLMVHMATATVARINRRKKDDSGWWLDADHGGLADSVIADGIWRPLRVVLAEHAAMKQQINRTQRGGVDALALSPQVPPVDRGQGDKRQPPAVSGPVPAGSDEHASDGVPMGSRTLPYDCPHGKTLDWGDFGEDPDDGSVGAETCVLCDEERDEELIQALHEQLDNDVRIFKHSNADRGLYDWERDQIVASVLTVLGRHIDGTEKADS